MTAEDDRLDELLGRGRLGRPARERILQKVIRGADIARPWYERKFLVWGSPALAAAALAVLAVMWRPVSDTMRAKGDARGGSIALGAECNGEQPNRCAPGDMIVFRVEGTRRSGFLAAYAQAEGSSERVWFFPLADRSEPSVSPQAEPQVLRQGVKVTSIGPGHYDVHLVLGARLLSKEEAVAGEGPDVLAVGRVAIEVVP
jgi:hypothetical protein